MKKTVLTFCIIASLLLSLTTGCFNRYSRITETTESTESSETTEVERPYSRNGFAAPEAAVLAYLEAFRDSDLERILSTFAIEIFQYDIEAFIRQTGVYSPWSSFLPNANGFTRDLNIEHRRNAVLISVFYQNRNLCMPDYDSLPPSFLDPSGSGLRAAIVVEKDKAEISELIYQIRTYLNSVPRSTVKVQGFVPVEAFSDTGTEPAYVWNDYDSLMERIGADSITGCIALFEMGGDMYFFCADVANYSGNWYIERLGGAALSATGIELDNESFERAAGIVPVPIDLYDVCVSQLIPIRDPDLTRSGIRIPQRIECDGFDSPEDAVTEYLTAFSDSDVARMIGAFSIESYVNNFDYQEYVYNMGFFAPWYTINLDSNEYEYSINVARRRSGVAGLINIDYRFLCLSDIDRIPDPDYLSPDGRIVGTILYPGNKEEDEEDIVALINWINERYNSLSLDSLEILGFIPRESIFDEFLAGDVVDNVLRHESDFGRFIRADELIGCAAVFELGGKTFLFCPNVVRYGDKWLIESLNGDTMRALRSSPVFSFDDIPGNILPIPDEILDRCISLIG